jgi:LPXTG-site transpeptidase (sortase) family protein
VNARASIAERPGNWRRVVFRGAYYFFLTGAILALGYSAYVVVDARAYQAIEESRLSNRRPTQGVHRVAEGDVIGEMNIPRLGLRTIVAQGESSKVLRRAVGHLRETPLPGEPGNVALAGHRDGFFRPLRNIQLGDAISLNTLDGEFVYQVESTAVVLPSDVRVLQASHENTLTLVTCFPFHYLGAAPQRFIVRARQIGRLPAESPIAEASVHF